MRISVKARYGLSAMICIAQTYDTGKCTTIISLAEKLDISKIYLEQVFSLLRRANLVTSTKGTQGGYQLAKKPAEIMAYDILSAIETSMFEKTESTVSISKPEIEETLQDNLFTVMDNSLKSVLSNISLEQLIIEVEKRASGEGYMYYL